MRRELITILVLSFMFLGASTIVCAADQLAQAASSSQEFRKSLNEDRPSQSTSASDEVDIADISKKLKNPMADLWMFNFQNDYTAFVSEIPGTQRRYFNTTSFQPVISVPIGDEWTLVNRPVFSWVNGEMPTRNTFDSLGLLNSGGSGFSGGAPYGGPSSITSLIDVDTDSSLGDFVFLSMIGPADIDKIIWGAGVTTMWPTATDDRFGSEKYSAGPVLTGAYLGDKWTVGALAQQWNSYAGDDDRSDVNKMNLQYFLYYNLPNQWTVGMAPNIVADWEQDEDNRWTVPVGLGVSKTLFLGKLPVKVGIEYQYSVIKPDFVGNEQNVRISFTPIIPNLIKMKQGKF
jgi:hypothetical protein